MISRRQILEAQRGLCDDLSTRAPSRAGAPETDAWHQGGKFRGAQMGPHQETCSRAQFLARAANKRAGAKTTETTKTTKTKPKPNPSKSKQQSPPSSHDYELELELEHEMRLYDASKSSAAIALQDSALPPAGAHAPAALAGQQQHFDPYSVYGEEDEEEDVWYSEERLFEDHIQEVLDKWQAIDDEIWAKIICLERNRRIAKAYARKHALTVNGSEDEYLDGTTLGLNSFDNAHRDTKTRHIKQYIGQGLGIKVSQRGDIFVERLSKANVFLQQLDASSACDWMADSYARNSELGDIYGAIGSNHRNGAGAGFSLVSNRALNTFDQSQAQLGAANSQGSSSSSSGVGGLSSEKTGGKGASSHNTKSLSSGRLEGSLDGGDYSTTSGSLALDLNRPVKIFDLAKFKELLERESRRSRPDLRRLRSSCISIISFVVDDRSILNLPSWIMIINVVAIDLLKSELGLMWAHELFVGDLQGDSQRLLAGANELAALQSPEKRHQRTLAGSDLHCGQLLSATPANGSSRYQVSASKRAFANAAALGAYNSHSCGHDPFIGPDQDEDHEEERKAEDERVLGPKRAASYAEDGARQDGSSSQPQSSSASSGFNSNCSSSNQNESSPSKQLDGPTKGSRPRGHPDDEDEEEEDEEEEDDDEGVYGLPVCPHPAQTRGERPPKLPQRVVASGLAASSRGAKMSGPIPIPAPPTSAGAGPSGKANLILVSPTGLSPPLAPKHKGAAAKAARASERAPVPQFTTIQHIDHTGQCRTIVVDGKPAARKPPLPPGIPAHAQLAPPATQLHILRYLMSAMAASARAEPQHGTNMAVQPRAHKMPVPSAFNYKRPLPFLPGQKAAKLAADESLYYHGLKARIPGPRAAGAFLQPKATCDHHQPLAASSLMNLVDNGNATRAATRAHVASEALLSELKHSQRHKAHQQHHHFHHFQQQQQQAFGYLKHQQSLNDLNESPDFGLNGYQNHCANSASSSSVGNLVAGRQKQLHHGGLSLTRPLMKLFKSSSGSSTRDEQVQKESKPRGGGKSSTDKQVTKKPAGSAAANQTNGTDGASPPFLASLDELAATTTDESGQPKVSLLSQLGFSVRGSRNQKTKVKKSKVESDLIDGLE